MHLAMEKNHVVPCWVGRYTAIDWYPCGSCVYCSCPKSVYSVAFEKSWIITKLLRKIDEIWWYLQITCKQDLESRLLPPGQVVYDGMPKYVYKEKMVKVWYGAKPNTKKGAF